MRVPCHETSTDRALGVVSGTRLRVDFVSILGFTGDDEIVRARRDAQNSVMPGRQARKLSSVLVDCTGDRASDECTRTEYDDLSGVRGRPRHFDGKERKKKQHRVAQFFVSMTDAGTRIASLDTFLSRAVAAVGVVAATAIGATGVPTTSAAGVAAAI